ncbi:MAG TPA: zinc-dependent metalloprotease [Mycobacteriales bacterium]|nr:zinc-dependent metalloprotease [Mycobacteriales bacterium]
MTRPPFGFGPGEGGDGDPADPLGLGALMGSGDFLVHLKRMMSWSGGPVNWDLAREVALAAGTKDDPPLREAEVTAVADACRLADLWLDPVTTLTGGGGIGRAWTRATWVGETLPAWQRLVDPVAGRVVAAFARVLEHGMEGELGAAVPPELRAVLGASGGLQGVLSQVGGMVFGAQVGQALGALAGEVVGAADVGLPLGDTGQPALLPANVAAFSAGLDVPPEEARLYLALRESAAQRLFTQVPWLQSHLYDAVDAYARGIELDPVALERAVGAFDPSDPDSLQRALGEGMFDVARTPAQEAALARLETALALVEGWVDTVVDLAATGHLPHSAALRETVRRRRATGGPAEQTFAALVGLTLRPRRLREAASLWAALTAGRGVAGRDAIWDHPDLLPGPADLDDPLGFAAGSPGETPGSGTDWDAALRDLDQP